MKVAVDARHLDGGRGVAEYTRGMVGALGGDVVLVGRRPKLAYAAGALLGRPRLGGGADVLWAPAPAPMGVAPGTPFVLTVHDLSWVERPGDFTAYERLWHKAGRLHHLARRADRVVVDAAATIEPLRRWGIDADRVRVVPPGVPERAVGDLPPGIDRDYVLFVGALEPRKDPELLVAAHAKARAKGLDADLVFAGAGRLAPRLHGPGVHVVDPSNGELGALYKHALVLAMPSRLEGFGFPPLEAARLGTPSVVTDLPVFRETLGDGAIRAPAGDADAWADALIAARDATPPIVQNSWETAAAALRAVFAEVAR